MTTRTISTTRAPLWTSLFRLHVSLRLCRPSLDPPSKSTSPCWLVAIPISRVRASRRSRATGRWAAARHWCSPMWPSVSVALLVACIRWSPAALTIKRWEIERFYWRSKKLLAKLRAYLLREANVWRQVRSYIIYGLYPFISPPSLVLSLLHA